MACSHRPRGRPADDGYVTPAFVVCVGLTLVVLVMAANLYVLHYARGVLQAAVEEGVRQGLAAGDAGLCGARADAAVRDGLGVMADQVTPATCTVGSGRVTASVDAAFRPWLPGVPAWPASAQAVITGRTVP